MWLVNLNQAVCAFFGWGWLRHALYGQFRPFWCYLYGLHQLTMIALHPKHIQQNRNTKRCKNYLYGQYSGYLLGAQTVRLYMLQIVTMHAQVRYRSDQVSIIWGYATLSWQGSPVDVNEPDLRWERMDAEGWTDTSLKVYPSFWHLMTFSWVCHIWAQDVRSWRRFWR